MIWTEKKTNKINLVKYKNQLNISTPMAKILLSMGIDFESAKALLERPADLLDIMTDVYGQKEVVDFISAADEDTKIHIFADYDVDGLTSGYIMHHYLSITGYDCDVYYPERSEGYGLNMDYAKSVVKAGGKQLVICVDNGITAFEPIDYLKEHGVPVVIIDHHEPLEELPSADAICDAWIDEGYGTHFCAAAVVWRVVITLILKHATDLVAAHDLIISYLPFVALATVSDVMPPHNENRAIVQLGLQMMDEGKSTVIKTLMNVENIEHMRVKDIAWTIAPELNACSRMDNIALAERLIFKEGEDDADLKDTARAVKELNRKRKSITEKACSELLTKNSFDKDLVCFADCSEYPMGIIGIIAGKLSEATGKPAIAYQEKDGVGYGSARAPQGVSVKDLVNIEASKGNAVGALGHAEACGVQILPEKIKSFNRDLIESGVVVEAEKAEPTEQTVLLDAVITPDDMSYDVRREINSFGYTSKDIPRIGILDAEVEALPWETSSGKRHLILSMKDSKGKDKYAVVWNGLDDYEAMGCPKKVNMAGTLDNGSFCRYFRGARIGEHSTILTVDILEGAA